MIKGDLTFPLLFFRSLYISISRFYVFLPIIYENLRNEKTHSVYTYFAALFHAKVSLIVSLLIILRKTACLRTPS